MRALECGTHFEHFEKLWNILWNAFSLIWKKSKYKIEMESIAKQQQKMTYYNCWLKSQFQKLKHEPKKNDYSIEEEKKSFKRPNNKWFHQIQLPVFLSKQIERGERKSGVF